MKRDLAALAGRRWDLLVVGGGIHGAFVAREAARRGLSTAVVERGDFASETSSRSQKIVHSGLRYLQHGDFIRLRESVRERTAFLAMAPHLVRLMPVLVPAYGHGRRGPELLRLALFLHDLAGLDRNRALPPGTKIPRGRVVGAGECRRLFPDVDTAGLTGGALWYDAQVSDTERFIMALLHDASAHGAGLANYVEVTGLELQGGRVTGARARDLREGRDLDLRAQVVVNAAGPWIGRICSLAGVAPPGPAMLSRAVVLVVGRSLVGETAVGLPGKSLYRDPDVVLPRSERLFFVTPWEGHTLVGSAHLPFDGDPDSCAVSDGEIDQLLAEVNSACPAWALGRNDVTRVYHGLLPTVGIDAASGSVQVEKKQRVRDHGRVDGTAGLVSVLGVKYTTARVAALRAVALAEGILGRRSPGDDRPAPVWGGEGGGVEELFGKVREADRPPVDDEVLRRLLGAYGSAWTEVRSLIEEDPALGGRVVPSAPVIGAEIVHALREEMAFGLDDLILRRTGLGSAGHPGLPLLERCADIAARELRWDGAERGRQIARAEEALGPGPGHP
ncbi:FAD-dependent oxidoreductase [Candidatus Moduliflexota bacterium]